ncbi:MAG: ABC transporter permease [Acidobacteria bacterium]|nr:ABC transporter permease [Acidobacteriota bacterium]
MLTALLNNKYLLFELVSRDIRSRYVGSILGVFWSVLNPLLQLVLYTVIFSVVLKIRFGPEHSTGAFAEYLFCALLPWMAIQEGVIRSSRTLIENSTLIKKIQFPLEVLPFSVVASAFVHQFLGTLVFLFVLIANQHLNADLFAVAFLFFIFQVLMTYGLSLIVACLNVFFRDIAQVLGVLFMLAFWMTPIVYPKSQAPALFRWFLNLNPLTHMVEAYRFVLLGSSTPSAMGVSYWMSFSIACFYVGRFILQRTHRHILDAV